MWLENGVKEQTYTDSNFCCCLDNVGPIFPFHVLLLRPTKSGRVLILIANLCLVMFKPFRPFGHDWKEGLKC